MQYTRTHTLNNLAARCDAGSVARYTDIMPRLIDSLRCAPTSSPCRPAIIDAMHNKANTQLVLTVIVLGIAALACGSFGAAPADDSPTATAFVPKETATDALPDTHIPPTATEEVAPSATSEPTALPPGVIPATLTPNGPLVDPADGPQIGVVTPASAAPSGTLDYAHADGIPANVEAWPLYDVRFTDLVIPVPPEWAISEWPVGEDSPFFLSASVAYPLPEGEVCFQCPAIEVTVWRIPPLASLNEWLHLMGTTAPFGSEAPEPVHYFGVTDVYETTLGPLPALGFTHTPMGIPVETVIADVNGVMVSLGHVYVGEIDLEPIFTIMRENARIGGQ